MVAGAQITTGVREYTEGNRAPTYHVEKRYIRLIHHEAEAEGVSITEVVNRAFRDYFEKR
jgi:hypothetical protein